MEEEDMLEIVDIRDATEEEIKGYTRKQESPKWQQRMMQVFLHRQNADRIASEQPAMIVGGADCNKWTGKQQHNF